MLFQGQEFAASSTFQYFSDLGPDLREAVSKGRAEFMSQFRSFGEADSAVTLPAPSDRRTFVQCKLDFSERARHAEAYALHKDLMQLRGNDPVFSDMPRVKLDGAVLAHRTFVVRYFAPTGNDRILLVNLDKDFQRETIPEPLLAPPAGCRWELLFSSEHPKYGGSGSRHPNRDADWCIAGESATVLYAAPVPSIETQHGKKI